MASKLKVNYKRVVLTGPESTGKTTLAEQLAKEFNTVWIPEFARQYAKEINNNFTYADVLDVARIQLVQELEVDTLINKVVFFDTSLIITKVWLDTVFHKVPQWLETQILFEEADLYLLCAPDIEWIPDPLRVNGGQKRVKLFERYMQELENYGFNYRIITGKGEDRLNACIQYVKQELKL
jgi:NadR type nicotinamide-nucleotide adenylyltransferase